MSPIAAAPIPAERVFQPTQGIAQDFRSVRDLSDAIADRAASFRAMARQLGELVDSFDR